MSSAEYRRIFFGSTLIKAYTRAAAMMAILLVAIFGPDWRLLAGVAGAIVVFPLLEYLIHRFLFHSQVFFRFPPTARIWRYLHYSHHMDPGDPNHIVGPPQFSLPVVAVFGLAEGWLVGGWPGALAGVATGLTLLVVYEYAHGYSHLVTQSTSRYGQMLRRLHLLHHFHNEKGNFGISSPVFDLLFGTYYGTASAVERCPTVRNLGYTEEMAERYPWAGQGGMPERSARAAWQYDLDRNSSPRKKNGGR